jgi:hypothetical protein
MPFGKFKGSELAELPDGYLSWLVENIDLWEPLRGRVLSEMEERGLLPDRPTSRGLDPDKVKTVYRELSMQFHPDRGGNSEAMKAINLFYERLIGRK